MKRASNPVFLSTPASEGDDARASRADGGLAAFHPAIQRWFLRRFGAPTDAQAAAWPAIRAGRDTLLAAPTGSGKTLAAFLSAIDVLLREAETGTLEETVHVVYVSPLKALSSDIQRNLESPLSEILETAREMGIETAPIRTALRTGDTPSSVRQEIVNRPPHILITTPESLYLMVTAARSREILRSARTLIVDEIHALLRDKRGSHLALTLARLDHLCARRPSRIGLSATQRPLERSARFLSGTGLSLDADSVPDCAVVDIGHARDMDLAIELPRMELEAVCSHEHWKDVYDRLAELIEQHRTTLVFVNTRRLAERAAHHLRERLGEEHVGAHHGSLAKERRFRLEQRLKAGQMKAIVATASLELGIDIGTVDLVCQLESPRGVSTFLQRIGRSGHALGLTPKGRLFPTTRDELVECVALLGAVRGGRLDTLRPPIAPLDILSQQLVAECAGEDWDEDDLFALVRKAAPYAELERSRFDAVVSMLSEGIPSGMGRAAHYLHRDGIHHRLHGRRNARRAAIESGGAIPENADYQVIAEPDGTVVGSLNEDFAIESSAGDIFLLGTTSWRIRRIERGVVRVEDAQGAPPTIPFWLGEAPGRTLELSQEVSRLREEIQAMLTEEPRGASGPAEAPIGPGGAASASHGGPSIPAAEFAVTASRRALEFLTHEAGGNEEAGRQILAYLTAELGALGLLPTRRDVVFERFFDESGGMQLIVHAPFGSAINRAWGLALRKKFCRTFDFELQAAATDDAVLLSLGPQNSFPLADVFQFVSSKTIVDTLERAVLTSPLWGTRWRWNATRALAIPRQRYGKKVPPPIQRMRSDDLLAAVFPQQVACQENFTGPPDPPDHPLVAQTMHDCLHEAMDTAGLAHVLREIEAGAVRLHARDTTEPSPFTHEVLNSKPYSFLDDAPLEERRARAITLRRTLPESARDLGALDPDAIERVVNEARPEPRDAEEVHEWFLSFVALPIDPAWDQWVDLLRASGRAGELIARGVRLWFATESLPAVEAIYFPEGSSGDGVHSQVEGASGDVVHSPVERASGDGVHSPVERASTDVARSSQGEAASAGGVRWVVKPRSPVGMAGAASRESALCELVRGHMENAGPVTIAELSARVALPESDLMIAMMELESQGAVLRGRFRAGQDEEFCNRRLLARIHRYTLDRLRQEIEPQTAQQYLRFLFGWQHVAPGAQLEGKRGLLAAIQQLQGFEAPALAWERQILAARVRDYDPDWLDELCLSGAVTWMRLGLRANRAEDGRAAPATATTPISLVVRTDLPWLLAGIRSERVPEGPTAGAAADVLDPLQRQGALFHEDLVRESHRLPEEVERGLWELVARGLVHADGFGSLRLLMQRPRERQLTRWRRARRHSRSWATPTGRWSLLPRLNTAIAIEELAESWARQLLLRYGVVFRDVVQRESFEVPWREILRALRRLEARGEVRGGRFVSGFYGEQYALPEALASLRALRQKEPAGTETLVGAVDPLNLVGFLTPGARVPSIHTRRIPFTDGVPGAVERRVPRGKTRTVLRERRPI